MEKVFTGAMALITVGTDATPIGKMRNLTVTENLNRGEVQGLGTILLCEVPINSWAGTVTTDFYLIDWSTARFQGSVKRDVSSNQKFEDYLILQEQGITINVFKKVSEGLDADGCPIPGRKPFCVLTRCFTNNESFNLAEGQIGGYNQSFQYLDPVKFPQ